MLADTLLLAYFSVTYRSKLTNKTDPTALTENKNEEITQ